MVIVFTSNVMDGAASYYSTLSRLCSYTQATSDIGYLLQTMCVQPTHTGHFRTCVFPLTHWCTIMEGLHVIHCCFFCLSNLMDGATSYYPVPSRRAILDEMGTDLDFIANSTLLTHDSNCSFLQYQVSECQTMNCSDIGFSLRLCTFNWHIQDSSGHVYSHWHIDVL